MEGRLEKLDTSLATSVYFNNVPRARSAIRSGANVNTVFQGLPVLIHAIRNRNINMIQLLLKYNVNTNCSDSWQNTALIHCLYCPTAVLLKTLLENGTNPDKTDANGRTPLLIATNMRNLYVIRLLVEYGADVNIADHFGNTPLFNAIQNYLPKTIIELFIHAGADLCTTNKHGHSPLSVACRKKYKEVASLIRKNIHAKSVSPIRRQPSPDSFSEESHPTSQPSPLPRIPSELPTIYPTKLNTDTDHHNDITAILEHTASLLHDNKEFLQLNLEALQRAKSR
jgi:ankyrin repeat protein